MQDEPRPVPRDPIDASGPSPPPTRIFASSGAEPAHHHFPIGRVGRPPLDSIERTQRLPKNRRVDIALGVALSSSLQAVSRAILRQGPALKGHPRSQKPDPRTLNHRDYASRLWLLKIRAVRRDLWDCGAVGLRPWCLGCGGVYSLGSCSI